MSLEDLKRINTQKAREGALSIFNRFLSEESVDMRTVDLSIGGGKSGSVVIALMDRFGLYLAYYKTKSGNTLASNTVEQYYRQVKGWILEKYPRGNTSVERALLKKVRVLKSFRTHRPMGKMVKQAGACTKHELRQLMTYLSTTATVPIDYLDIALLSLLWFIVGRASDLTMLQKENLSICSSNVLFLRIMRVMTTDEQGMSLFPDVVTSTCPITAMAAALVMQTRPSASLLPQLPVPSATDVNGPSELVPLSFVLSGTRIMESLKEQAIEAQSMSLESDEVSGPNNFPLASAKTSKQPPGIHAYVNRLLGRISKPTGVQKALTSHSFRRGGAQHGNGNSGLSLQWIVDRGGWNLSTQVKAFMYIFNTTQEDQRVAKVLAGRDVDANVPLLSLADFDCSTLEKIHTVKKRLFECCIGLVDARLNVPAVVVDTLCAYFIKSFPQIKSMKPASPLIGRVEEVLAVVGVEYSDWIAWSNQLQKSIEKEDSRMLEPSPLQLQMMKQQATMIEELISVNKKLVDRVREVEARLEEKADNVARLNPGDQVEDLNPMTSTIESPKAPKRRIVGASSLLDTWYEWYACNANASQTIGRQKKSDMRLLVSFMQLFLDDYKLDDSATSFRDDVLIVGSIANAAVEAFFMEHGITARAVGTALKAFRQLHKVGHLNTRIAEFNVRLQAGMIRDPIARAMRPGLQPALLSNDTVE
ncbi:hypothetical protein AeRB84_016536 [Aphanomyces euteiches]|nr:hypothetical protein AeRB84_016536 [Aphanomyces euteiches]